MTENKVYTEKNSVALCVCTNGGGGGHFGRI